MKQPKRLFKQRRHIDPTRGDRRSAVHEAGHAVVAIVLGLPLQGVRPLRQSVRNQCQSLWLISFLARTRMSWALAVPSSSSNHSLRDIARSLWPVNPPMVNASSYV
jgi:hypothetical protein